MRKHIRYIVSIPFRMALRLFLWIYEPTEENAEMLHIHQKIIWELENIIKTLDGVTLVKNHSK